VSWSGTRAALRIARRDALRAKGRSILVLAMIGLPMLGIAFADVAARTGQLPPAESARREIGTADLVVRYAAHGPVQQYSAYDYRTASTPVDRDEPQPEPGVLLAALPAGSRVEAWDEAIKPVSVPGRKANANVYRLDPTGLAAGTVRLRGGRFARAAGEAVLSVRLARTLGVRTGGTVTIDAMPLRVTGLAVDPKTLSLSAVWMPPATPLALRERRYAVGLPPGANDLTALNALNAKGFMGRARSWFFHPPSNQYATGPSAQSVGLAVVVIGLATLEVVLLAGTAFAVGARRQRRALALVAATGGDRKDVRRIVLAGGAVLGAAAAVLGIAGGVALALALRPFSERLLLGSLIGPLDLRPLDLLAIVGVGVGTALLAAMLPARTASRQPVVAALTGRRTETVTRLRVPAVALLAVAAGCALAFWAAGDGKVPAGESVSNGRGTNFPLLLAGAVVAELGFVACAPSLVGLVGRLGRRLPLSFRLAARDAARHRARSGPAVAAVVAAVAGSVAVSLYLASDLDRQRTSYVPEVPAGSVRLVRAAGDPVDANVAAAAAKLPVRDTFDIVRPSTGCAKDGGCDAWSLELPPTRQCTREVAQTDLRCAMGLRGDLLVGGANLVSWVTGSEDPALARALAAGQVVVFDARFVENGTVRLMSRFGAREEATVRLPAVVASARTFRYAPDGVLSAATARRAGIPVDAASDTVFTTTRMPTRIEQAEAAAAAGTDTIGFDLYVERGFQADNSIALLALLAASALVTVGSTGIATGLAAADSRPDLATLAAVGAEPKVRRRLAVAQAATVAALGSALGILAGLIPAGAVILARAELRLVLPWTLAVIAVGVPLLAALLVGLCTRAKLPLDRRLA
jgi:putative ABC transport system permease protein